MWLFYILFLVPLLIFVSAFLYETWLSFVRLRNPAKGRSSYVTATWETTHTLLVFTVVMLLMTFTQALDQLAAAIFWPTFIAAVFLGLRAVAYIYIFYVRKTTAKANWIDWFFAFTHIGAALFSSNHRIKSIVVYHPRKSTGQHAVFPTLCTRLNTSAHTDGASSLLNLPH